MAVVVSVAQPKARWWLMSSVFPPGDSEILCPIYWLSEYRRLSKVPLRDDGPAFIMSDGKTLTRDYMVRRTSDLMKRTGIQVIDETGRHVPVLASRRGDLEAWLLPSLLVLVTR